MSAPVRLLLICLGILALSLMGLALVSPVLGEDLPFRIPVRDPIELATHWRIPYEYEDFQRSRHRFYCDIEKEALARETATFGLPVEKETIWQELDDLLQQKVIERAGGLRKYGKFKISHEAGPHWDWQIADRGWNFSAAPENQRRALEKAANELESWIDERLKETALLIANEYYLARGYFVDESTGTGTHPLGIDYKGISERAKSALEDCYHALVRESGARDESEQMSLMLAFFQDLRFEVPPQEESGVKKSGFWPPLEVMKRRMGDCDSKSVGLCSLWRGYPTQIILIEQENPMSQGVSSFVSDGAQESDLHLLIGIEAAPQIDQAYVEIGLRRFVLCEVAGPAKYQPGRRPLGRHKEGRIDSKSFKRYFCITDDCPGTRAGWNWF